jgi:hypothetical protein
MNMKQLIIHRGTTVIIGGREYKKYALNPEKPTQFTLVRIS